MTTKIYRLADERDVGKRVFFSKSNALKSPYNDALLLGITFDGYKLNLDMGFRDTEIFYRKYAFVEVTPADFSDEEIKAEYNKRFPLRLFGGAFGDSKLHSRKEKTLADFSDQEIRGEAIYKRGLIVFGKEEYDHVKSRNHSISYGECYEAGKRDAAVKSIEDVPQKIIDEIAKEWYEQGKYEGEQLAEPKWISVEERLPDNGDFVFVIADNGQPFTGTYVNNEWSLFPSLPAVTLRAKAKLWMPLPEPSKQEEQKPKYKCSWCLQCNTQFNLTDDSPFCSLKCQEDYEWADAEYPAHHGLPCRYADYPPGGWQEGKFIYKYKCRVNSTYAYLVLDEDNNECHAAHCQVRKDSVEQI